MPPCQWKFRGEAVVPVCVVLEGLRVWSKSRATSVPQVELSQFRQLAVSKVCFQEAWGRGKRAVPGKSVA